MQMQQHTNNEGRWGGVQAPGVGITHTRARAGYRKSSDGWCFQAYRDSPLFRRIEVRAGKIGLEEGNTG